VKPAKENVVYDPAVHHRRSIRLRGYDYSRRGIYFVTICTEGRRRLFGTVINGRMALNDAGHVAARCWREIPNHFPNVALDEWVVMPDHIHGILVIERDGFPDVGAKNLSPLPNGTSRTIGSMVRGFKVGVTKALGGDSPWQRNYHEMIVRDARALNAVRAYIQRNPACWNVLRFGEPRFFAGNRSLLDLPQTAFLASRSCRGEKSFAFPDTGETFLARTECVISGFLSPMERAVLDDCLADGVPVIQVLARGLPDAFPPHVRRAMDAGRVLVMTPFDSQVSRSSAERAAWCNQYALHLAERVVVGRLNPDGQLACLLADLSRETVVTFL
jgi:REP element-mobilizing transposase RayT